STGEAVIDYYRDRIESKAEVRRIVECLYQLGLSSDEISIESSYEGPIDTYEFMHPEMSWEADVCVTARYGSLSVSVNARHEDEARETAESEVLDRIDGLVPEFDTEVERIEKLDENHNNDRT
ncbi:MAG: hypothetical protein ABEI54_02220, partial [Candidatus Bipolaricaulia bacterium]